MAVPYTFGSATSSIPLSQLDSNFATGITLGNTTVYLGNTTTSFGNVTLTNVTISSVAAAITPSQGGTGLITIPANNVILGNGTSNVTVVAPGTSGNVLTSNGTTWSSATISAASVSAAGSTTQVQYNNAGAFAGSANLTFNGTTLTAAGLSGPHNGTVGATTPSTGAFTTLAASSTVSGTGFSTYLASPPAIGGTAPAAGAFTTLTATTAIGTSSGGTGLTSFTSGGVVYASSSSALATGSALTFDGTTFAITTGSVNISGGRGSTRALQFPDWGVYNSSTGNRLVFDNGSEQMTLTSTGLEVKQSQLIGYSSYAGIGTNGLAVAGNVGIGTSSPSQKLQVVGAIAATGQASALTASSAFFDYISSINSARYAVVGNTTGTTGSIIFSQYSSNGSVGRDAAIIDSAGNLGLGVTPSAWYTAYGFKALQVGLYGFTSVADGGSAYTSRLMNNSYYNSSGIATFAGSNYASEYRQTTGVHSWHSSTASGTAGNPISFIQAMTLDANSNLMVGTTTPPAVGSGNLKVNGRVQNLDGTGTILTSTSITLFTMPTSGVYIVNATFANFTGGSTTALVWLPASGNTAYSGAVILGQNSAAFTITVSGAGVVLSSLIGATATYYWSAIKLY